MTSIENSTTLSLNLLFKDIGNIRSLLNVEKDNIFNPFIKCNLVERVEAIFNCFTKVSSKYTKSSKYIELKLSLNDLLTQVIFFGIEKEEDVQYFIQMKDQLLTSCDSLSQSNILATIKQKLMKAFKEEELEVIWAMRAYRILIESCRERNSFFELNPSAISTSKIVLCARNILSKEGKASSKELTSRHFNVVVASKLLLNRLNPRLSSKHYFSFNKLTKSGEDIFGLNDQIAFLNSNNSKLGFI